MTAVRVEQGDCREVLRTMAADSLDACVTDAPYHLASIVKRFSSPNAAPARQASSNAKATGAFARASKGFMGKTWDGGDVAMDPATWAEVFRVLKPGAHLVNMCGTKTEHRVACAIEDAGFEIRDRVLWLYGTGMPKSHKQGDGRGTGLKPGMELGVLARKPLDGTVGENLARWGTGAINIDACRIPGEDPRQPGRWPANVCHDGSAEVVAAFPDAPGQRGDVSRNPGLKTSNVYGDMQRCRDDEESGGRRYTNIGATNFAARPGQRRFDTGSAARFFYSAKATKADRLFSKHPTVKPVDLMGWLARLITPPGGIVLDPFAGTGTTAAACIREGFGCVLIEREAESIADIQRRLAHISGPDSWYFAEDTRAARGRRGAS